MPLFGSTLRAPLAGVIEMCAVGTTGDGEGEDARPAALLQAPAARLRASSAAATAARRRPGRAARRDRPDTDRSFGRSRPRRGCAESGAARRRLATRPITKLAALAACRAEPAAIVTRVAGLSTAACPRSVDARFRLSHSQRTAEGLVPERAQQEAAGRGTCPPAAGRRVCNGLLCRRPRRGRSARSPQRGGQRVSRARGGRRGRELWATWRSGDRSSRAGPGPSRRAGPWWRRAGRRRGTSG